LKDDAQLHAKFNRYNGYKKRTKRGSAPQVHDPLFRFEKGSTKMSKKKKQTNHQTHSNHQQNTIFDLRAIRPLTLNQELMFESYDAGYHLMLHGYAGTGKTYISLYKSLKQILTGKSPYDRIVIVRSVVPSREMGFLPGSIKDKTRVFEEPYKEICDDLFARGDGYEILKMKKLVDFTTTSFLRGTTFNNSIVIVDESANLTFQEIDTVMTRIGNNSRVIFCGDYRQTDLNKPHEKEGITQFMKITHRINTFKHIEFGKEDIVRSDLVRDYIIQKTDMGY
jgi:phosphate starvation-inducible PhoH-like protein